MRVIALEEHLETPEVAAAWSALDPQNADDMFALMSRGAVERRLLDLTDERLRDMDASGVDVQVLSLTSPGVQSLEPTVAVELAQRTNDSIANTVREHPDRFQGFATLPTPDPDAAATELRRAVEDLGLVGAMLHGRTREKNLDHRDFEPIFATASELGVPLYVHPQIPQRPVRSVYYSDFGERIDVVLATAGVGWHYETGIQMVRMILAGVFDRHPDLQIILGHWGEMVLFYLERLDAIAVLGETTTELPISEYFRRNSYATPSGMFSQNYLDWAVTILGVDRILFSTDYPYLFEPDKARTFLESSSLDEADQQKIAAGNWERLTRRAGARTS